MSRRAKAHKQQIELAMARLNRYKDRCDADTSAAITLVLEDLDRYRSTRMRRRQPSIDAEKAHS